MDSVDKTLNCILPSSRVSCQYFQYVNTHLKTFESGHRKSLSNVTEIYCDNATFRSK